jgi:hypothetical protein
MGISVNYHYIFPFYSTRIAILRNNNALINAMPYALWDLDSTGSFGVLCKLLSAALMGILAAGARPGNIIKHN